MFKKATVAFALVTTLSVGAAYAAPDDYDKGIAFLRAGRAEEALKVLTPLSRKDPKDPYVRYHIGLALYKMGSLDEASEEFNKAAEISGGKAREELGIGAAFSNLGIAYYRKKELAKAEEALLRALDFDTSDGDSRYYLGLVLTDKGLYAGALSQLDMAFSLKASDTKAKAAVLVARGLVFYRQEDMGKAVAEFGRALEADPDSVQGLYYMGLANYKENGYSAAKVYFDQLARKGASDEKAREGLFTTFFNMGIDFQGRDKSGPAEEMFARAISLKSSDADAHFYRGYNLSALERYEEAADEFRQALKLNPEMQKAKGQLEVAGKFASEAAIKDADEMMGRGEYKTAELKFRKALLLDPSSPEARKGAKEASEALAKDTAERIARVRAALGKAEFAKARDEAKELARLNPGPDSEAVNREVREKTAQAVKELMAQADEAEGSEVLSEAIFACEKAVLVDPSNGAHTERLRRLRGKISEESARAKDALKDGRFAAAKKSYERLVRYDSGDADAKAGLASVNARIEQETAKAIARARESIASGDMEKAAAQINRALEYSPQDVDALAIRRKLAQRASDIAAPAVVVDEQEVRRVYLQGVEHYTKGELAEAIASWREVLKLDPKNEKASSNIARAEDKLKEASGKGGK